MREAKDLIAAAYEAFNRRDIESALALITPDGDWPNGMEGGRVIGHNQVGIYWVRQFSVLKPPVDSVAIEEEQSGEIPVPVHQVVCDGAVNGLVDYLVRHVYSFKDGGIDRMDIRDAETPRPRKSSFREQL